MEVHWCASAQHRVSFLSNSCVAQLLFGWRLFYSPHYSLSYRTKGLQDKLQSFGCQRKSDATFENPEDLGISLCRLRFEDIWVSLAAPTVCLDYQTKDEGPMTVLGVTIGKAEEHASEPAEACLSDWRRDCDAIVLELPGGDQLSARLRELGILPGTLIRVLRTGAHLVVQTGDTRLALRREDCDGVRVGAVPAVI